MKETVVIIEPFYSDSRQAINVLAKLDLVCVIRCTRWEWNPNLKCLHIWDGKTYIGLIWAGRVVQEFRKKFRLFEVVQTSKLLK